MKALIVDDDRVLADVLSFTLRREGFQVMQAYDGESALERWEKDQPDIILLDVNLPRLDGFSVCRRIRAVAETPILLLTVRDEEDDIIHGLGLGADDYITKPFSPRQLIARIHTILRRSGVKKTPAIRQVGSLTLDSSRREIRFGEGEPLPLTPLECQLLDYLILNVGNVLTYETIIYQTWGPEGADRDMLRQLVHRLRSKLSQAQLLKTGLETNEDDAQNLIETVPGLGYGLVIPR